MPEPPFPPEEMSFLRTILDVPEDRNILLVYADWLDDRCDSRAEFVRLLADRSGLPVGDPAYAEIESRLAQLRAELDPKWVMVFDPARVANCRECPWQAMAATDLLDIRICRECRRSVVYCHTLAEARQFASCGQRVALSTQIPQEQVEQEPALRPPPPEPDPDPEWELDLEEFLDAEPPAPPIRSAAPPRPWWQFWS